MSELDRRLSAATNEQDKNDSMARTADSKAPFPKPKEITLSLQPNSDDSIKAMGLRSALGSPMSYLLTPKQSIPNIATNVMSSPGHLSAERGEFEGARSNQESIYEENIKLKEEIKVLNSSFAHSQDTIKRYRTKISDLVLRITSLKKENESVLMSYKKLHTIYEIEKLALMRVNHKLRINETLMDQLKARLQKDDEVRDLAQNMANECLKMLENTYSIFDVVSPKKDNPPSELWLSMASQLKSLEKTLSQLDGVSQYTVGGITKKDLPQEESNEEIVARYINYGELKTFENLGESFKEKLAKRLEDVDERLQSLEGMKKYQASELYFKENPPDIRTLTEFLYMEREELVASLNIADMGLKYDESGLLSGIVSRKSSAGDIGVIQENARGILLPSLSAN